MESSQVESKRPLSNYFPPIADLAKRSAAYAVTSVLTGRINPVIITSSLINASAVSFAKQIADAESGSTKELIVTIISLAGSTLFLSFVAAPLVGRIADVSAGTMLKLGFFNAIGEAALVYVVPYILEKAHAPKVPKSVEEVNDLSKNGILYIRDHFEAYKEMFKDSELMVAFSQRLLTEEVLPPIPQTVEEIKEMSLCAVHHACHSYDNFEQIFKGSQDVDPKDLFKALHTRFYEQDLPFPNGNTVKSLNGAKQPLPLVTVEAPKSTKEVEELSDNQLAWVYAGVDNNYQELMGSMLFEVQVAFNARIVKDLSGHPFYYQPTLENIKGISAEHVKLLHDEFTGIEKVDNGYFWLNFKTLPSDLKIALNAKFKEHPECTELAPDYVKVDCNSELLNPAEKDDQKKIRAYYSYYSNNDKAWNALEKGDQEKWNKLFVDDQIRRPALPAKN